MAAGVVWAATPRLGVIASCTAIGWAAPVQTIIPYTFASGLLDSYSDEGAAAQSRWCDDFSSQVVVV